MISCFKWFSTVFERLKPRLRVFLTSSLSKYNTMFLLLFILHSHPRACKGTFNVISLVLIDPGEKRVKLGCLFSSVDCGCLSCCYHE